MGQLVSMLAVTLQPGVHLAAARERTLTTPGVATPVPMASLGEAVLRRPLASWSRPPQHVPQLPPRSPRPGSAGQWRRPRCGPDARTPSTVA